MRTFPASIFNQPENAAAIDVNVDGNTSQKKAMITEPHGKSGQRRTERHDSERDRLEKALEIGLEDTFPASDAVAAVQPGAQPTQ
jgi:hypothetical protein